MNITNHTKPKEEPSRPFLHKQFPSHKQLILAGLTAGSSLCLLMLGVLATKAQEVSLSFSQENESLSSLINGEEPVFDLAQPASYAGLSVGEVVSHLAENAQGTIVFIPQYHRNPSTAVEDSSNDASYRAQVEIYGIVKTLRERAGIDTVMIEGEIHGPVENETVHQVQVLVQRKNRLTSLRQALEPVFNQAVLDDKRENRLLKSLDKKIAELDRAIVLKGASQQLAAEGVDVELIGVENPETLAEGREIIRDYVYIRDRLAEVQSPAPASSEQKRAQKPNAKAQALLALLTQSPSGGASGDARRLRAIALEQRNGNAVNLLTEVENVLNETPPKRVVRTSQNSDSGNVPSRANNPYENVSSVQQLKEHMNKVEADIQTTVIDRRNQETAHSVAESLHAKQEDIGILQFGAGHKEGLVEELNKQGLSVIVVTPTEVFNKTLGE